MEAKHGPVARISSGDSPLAVIHEREVAIGHRLEDARAEADVIVSDARARAAEIIEQARVAAEEAAKRREEAVVASACVEEAKLMESTKADVERIRSASAARAGSAVDTVVKMVVGS
ncbi:MAG: V-type ATPase subunit subunit G family protein [Coriobacteriia bacterium]